VGVESRGHSVFGVHARIRTVLMHKSKPKIEIKRTMINTSVGDEQKHKERAESSRTHLD
jgi:hypothetical protein